MQPRLHTRPALGRRQALALMSAPLVAPLGARAADWLPPSQVDYVVPSGPGAALDMAARRLGSILEQQNAVRNVTVSNKTGGLGMPALHQLRQNEGNASVVSTLSASLLTSHASGSVPWNFDDFTPLAVLLEEYVAVAVKADSPVRDARGLATVLRTNPQALSIGVASSLGNHIHMGIARPLAASGVDVQGMTVVPFRSSAESLTALIGGHVDVVSCSTPNLIAHVAAGRVRVLAVDSPQRLAGALTAVPTWREQGIPVEGITSQGLLAPRGIGPQARTWWEGALRRATATSEWQNFLAMNQLRPRFLTGGPAEFYLRGQYAQMALALKRLRLDSRAT
ncbi:tripartite tricarboxylate transporter substrate binding protein [Xylophilus sp. Kf1]|nr:tripartite tricarboxylate transporter substrate binding protein [Xylophilus sp. Kf1]